MIGKAALAVAAIVIAIIIIEAVGHILLLGAIAVVLFGAGYQTKSLQVGVSKRLKR